MKILVRAPNWLGDLVMSLGFFDRLRQAFPGAEIHLVIKDTLADLAALSVDTRTIHRFSRATNRGLIGAAAFGRAVARHGPYDRFYCLPNSFSSAWMGCFTGSRARIGYRNEGRSFLLTQALRRPGDLHRAEEYAALLDPDIGPGSRLVSVSLPIETGEARQVPGTQPDTALIAFNCNSEAPSRRMSREKWAAIAGRMLADLDCRIVLIGSSKEAAGCAALAAMIGNPHRVIDMSGKTDLPQLARLLKSCVLLISTDSGPAHLANAVGTPVVVLFGAGDDRKTAPYRKEHLAVVRTSGLNCAPCVSNICTYGDQRCLERIGVEEIVETAERTMRGRGGVGVSGGAQPLGRE
jgi:heptosyltransferase II